MRLASLIAAALLAALITGAVATTAASLTVEPTELWRQWAMMHRMLARGAVAIVIALLVWTLMREARLRVLPGLMIVGVLIESALGEMPNGVIGWGGMVHATLAPVLLGGGAAVAMGLSSVWTREPQLIQDYGWPSLRSLAIVLPVLIALQVAAGAAFRHQLLGLMPHIMGALLVSMFILMVSAFVLQQCKDHKLLTLWARILMVTTFVQVFLGIGLYTVRAIPGQSPNLILSVAAAHIGAGALLLAVSILLGMTIRRNVWPKNVPMPAK